MTVEIKPVGKRLLIERLEAEDRTEGGLYLPDNAKEQPHLARVLEVGSLPTYLRGRVKAGDVIVYKKYAGQAVEECLLIEADEVLAVVTGMEANTEPEAK